MEKEFKNFLMEIHTKDLTKTVNLMAMGNTFGVMVVLIKVNLTMD